MLVTSSQVTTLETVVDGYVSVRLAAVQYPITLVGFADITEPRSETPILGNLYVHPDLRRLGIATSLLRHAKQWAHKHEKSLYLHVKPDNPSRALYEAEGFEYTGEVSEEGSLWMVKLAHEGRIAREEEPRA
jgi:GNAT superfamily N-acetyltransferase